MRRMVWTLCFSISCGGSNAPTSSEVRFSLYEVESLTTRFRVEDEERQLDGKMAFSVRPFCPKISSARFEPDPASSLGTLQVWGEGMEAVWGIAGRGEDGGIGEAKAKKEVDGSLRFAVGCRDCEIVLGIKIGDQKIGCLGPGYSLSIRDRMLVY